MQPMQLSRDPQTRFVGMRHRRFDQGLGHLGGRGMKPFARLIHPCQHGWQGKPQDETGRRSDVKRGRRAATDLASDAPQSANIRAVLHRFGDPRGERTDMLSPAGAAQLKGAILDHLVVRRR